MNWNPQSMKELRQRCGWSLAEMARYLGCRMDTVKNFEGGSEAPDPEVRHAMENLLSSAQANAQYTLRRAQAESRLSGSGLDQVHCDDIDRLS